MLIAHVLLFIESIERDGACLTLSETGSFFVCKFDLKSLDPRKNTVAQNFVCWYLTADRHLLQQGTDKLQRQDIIRGVWQTSILKIFLACALVLSAVFCSAQEQAASKIEPPKPTAEQLLLFREANRFRKLMGLPPFKLSLKLCASAQAHCHYSYHHPGESHYEAENKEEFRGKTPTDRARGQGYTEGVSEDMSFGGVIEDAVAGLVEAPYHRVLFMQPGSPDFGCGYDEGIVTLDFGTTERKEWVVYPADGQRDVPLTFTGNEIPDPLRLHGAKPPAGYIVTLLVCGEADKIRIVSTDFTTKRGESVPYFLNTPDTDEFLNYGVFLIPRKPLLPLTEYTASVTFQRGDGAETAVVWSFKTGRPTAFPPLGIKSPRKAAAPTPTSGRSKRSGARRTKPSSQNLR